MRAVRRGAAGGSAADVENKNSTRTSARGPGAARRPTGGISAQGGARTGFAEGGSSASHDARGTTEKDACWLRRGGPVGVFRHLRAGDRAVLIANSNLVPQVGNWGHSASSTRKGL